MSNANLKEIVEVDGFLERAAYHTAGHAWAYIKSGVEVVEVQISAGTECYGNVRTEPPYVVDISDEMSVMYTTRIVLGGCVAEELHFGGRLDDVEGDRLAASKLICCAALSEIFLPQGASRRDRRAMAIGIGSLPKYCEEYLGTEEDLIRKEFTTDWASLDAIAGALLENGQLAGDAIDDLLEEV